MHHGCDAVRRVLYLFYFLALPFSILFYFSVAYFITISGFCKKKFIRYWLIGGWHNTHHPPVFL